MPYLDNFKVAGGELQIRDLEAREAIENLTGTIAGSAGDSNTPIYLDSGIFKECGNTLNVDISGNANTATNSQHSVNADNATMSINSDNANSADTASRLSSDAGDAHLPVYFADGVPEACEHELDVDITGTALSAMSADSADKLNTDAGEPAYPVYFKNGVPVQCDKILNVAVLGNAGSSTISERSITMGDSGGLYNAGNSKKPVYFVNGKPTQCDNLINNNTTGFAGKLAISDGTGRTSGDKKRPIWFNDGVPNICDKDLNVNITGSARSLDTRGEINNSTVHVFTCTNANIKTMDGYTQGRTFNINQTYGNLFYADVTINLPTYFSGLLCVNVTPQGSHACYFNVTTFSASQINGYLVCPINISVSMSLFMHVVGF